MIEVYLFSTPNSIRVPIALEELGLHYEVIPVNVRKGEQKLAKFLAMNPNGKVPVLVDPHGPGDVAFTLTESAAILIYLAEKTGLLIPSDLFERARVFEQMFFHVTGIGPAFGQVGFFKRQAPEQIPLAISRFEAEAERTLRVLDGVLGRSKFVAGDIYSIADITHFGWLWRREFAGVDFSATPNVARWFDEVAARPAVVRAVELVTAWAARSETSRSNPTMASSTRLECLLQGERKSIALRFRRCTGTLSAIQTGADLACDGGSQ